MWMPSTPFSRLGVAHGGARGCGGPRRRLTRRLQEQPPNVLQDLDNQDSRCRPDLFWEGEGGRGRLDEELEFRCPSGHPPVLQKMGWNTGKNEQDCRCTTRVDRSRQGLDCPCPGDGGDEEDI